MNSDAIKKLINTVDTLTESVNEAARRTRVPTVNPYASKMRPAPGRPQGSMNSVKTVRGYQYKPEDEEQSHSERFVKILHVLVDPKGKEHVVDFTPYNYMDEEDIRNWLALRKPKRRGIGAWDKQSLAAAAAQSKLEKRPGAPAARPAAKTRPVARMSTRAKLKGPLANDESLNESASTEDIKHAILLRLSAPQYQDIVSQYPSELVEDIVYEVASFYEGMEELGTSDVGVMVREVIKRLQHQSNHRVSENRATLRKAPRKGSMRYEIEQRRKKYDSSPQRQKEIDAIGNRNHYFGNAKVSHNEVKESAAASQSVFNQLVQMRRDKTGGDLTIGNETMPIQYAHANRLLQVYRTLQIRSGTAAALERLGDYSFVESVLDEFDQSAKTSAARSSVPGQRVADNYDTPAAARATQGLNEAIKLGSRVVIHDPGKDYHGKVGHVGEIRRGPHKTANKTYTIDYKVNGRTLSVQLDKKKIKQATDEAADPTAKIEAKIEKLKKQRESVRDRIGIAKEKRRAKGQVGVQGDAEIKLARKAADLLTQIMQLEQELEGLEKVNETVKSKRKSKQPVTESVTYSGRKIGVITESKTGDLLGFVFDRAVDQRPYEVYGFSKRSELVQEMKSLYNRRVARR